MASKKEENADQTVVLDHQQLMYSLYSKQSGQLPQSFIECVEGQDQGRSYLLNETQQVIGRSNQCHIRLTDPAVSGKHAVIHRFQDDLMTEDLDSANGVFVNGQRVKRSKLANNDQIRLGHTLFRIRLTESA